MKVHISKVKRDGRRVVTVHFMNGGVQAQASIPTDNSADAIRSAVRQLADEVHTFRGRTLADKLGQVKRGVE